MTVTRGRVAMLRRAVACFRRQTLPDAELVVVHDADDDATAGYLATLADPAIRAVVAPPGLKLGALRNLAVQSARGQFVAQWDDDDWYAPTRLAEQLDALRSADRAACVLGRWTIFDALTATAYVSHPRTWEGSLVARRSRLVAYDDTLSRGEDTPVVDALRSAGELTVLDRPDLYVYVFHGRNTFDRQHWREILSLCTPLPPADSNAVVARLRAD